MGRKSLRGRATCLVTENNDDIERESRRTTTLYANVSNSQLDETKIDWNGADKEDESATNQKKIPNGGPTYDITSVLNMCSANKVNVTNTWTLDLLDHIDEVLGSQADSFQKASCTLQASVQIYEKRVDSTHLETFRMLENVNRTRSGNAADAEESREARRKGNSDSSKKNSRGIANAFLESNLRSITTERVEREFQVDSLFRKISKTFDAGGASGLLLNHLNVDNGPNTIFDTSETFAFPKNIKGVEAEEFTNPAEEDHQLSFEHWSLQLGPTNPAPVCPSIEVLFRAMQAYNQSGNLDDDEKTVGLADETVDLNQYPTHIDGFNEEEAGFLFDDPHFDDDPDFEACETDERDERTKLADNHSNESFSKKNIKSLDFNDIDFSQVDSYSFFKPHVFNLRSNANWAGPSHWKLIRRQELSHQFGKLTGRKKTDKTSFLDLFTEHDKDQCKALDVVNQIGSINLAKRTNSAFAVQAKNNDLPEDLHYSIHDLCKLFLKPVIISEVLGRPSDKQKKENHLSEGLRGFCDEDHDAGFFDSYCASDDKDVMFEGDKYSMVAPSHLVGKIDIGYAMKATSVDVKKLKSTLWAQLEHLQSEIIEENTEKGFQQDSNHDEKCPTSKSISFVDSMTAAAPEIADPNVTVPFYFICLLHLANEKNLEFEGKSNFADFIIK